LKRLCGDEFDNEISTHASSSFDGFIAWRQECQTQKQCRSRDGSSPASVRHSSVSEVRLENSSSGKEGKSETFEHLGYSQDLIAKIGVLGIALAIVYLIPRTSFLGAILLTSYLGGAITDT
jgi:hypothetical protein